MPKWDRPRNWKNSDRMTDFIMNVDKHHCALRGACAAKSFLLVRPTELKALIWNENELLNCSHGRIEELTEAVPTEEIKEGTRKLIIKAFSFTLILKLSVSFLKTFFWVAEHLLNLWLKQVWHVLVKLIWRTNYCLFIQTDTKQH